MSHTNLAPRNFRFPAPFKHQHPPVQNVNDLFQEQLTLGQRTADGVASMMGSWIFIVAQSIILFLWVVLNVVGWIRAWDPYPFILMNLILSMQAAYAAPIIMMSQNRQAAKDRLEAHHDFLVNQKAEEEIRVIIEHLEAQDRAIAEIHEILVALQTRTTPPQ